MYIFFLSIAIVWFSCRPDLNSSSYVLTAGHQNCVFFKIIYFRIVRLPAPSSQGWIVLPLDPIATKPLLALSVKINRQFSSSLTTFWNDKLQYFMWDFRFSQRRVWSLESSWMYNRADTLNSTDVSEVCTASIFIAMMMEAVRTSETSVSFNVTTRRYIPEDSKVQYCMLKYKCYWNVHK
jgi:hypothetical protein